jgi:hypothetical protein
MVILTDEPYWQSHCLWQKTQLHLKLAFEACHLLVDKEQKECYWVVYQHDSPGESSKETVVADLLDSISGGYIGYCIAMLHHMPSQVYKMVKSRPVVSEPTLSIQKENYTLQEPEQSITYHILHGLTNISSQTYRSVTACEEAIFPWFQNRSKHFFSPGS